MLRSRMVELRWDIRDRMVANVGTHCLYYSRCSYSCSDAIAQVCGAISGLSFV
jgi:hypothetical protein